MTISSEESGQEQSVKKSQTEVISSDGGMSREHKRNST
jgi:hypothetical protein